MGSIFPSDNSGLVFFLVGLILVVLFGVALTVLTDGDNISLPGRERPDSVAADQAERIVELKNQRKELLAQKREHEAAGQATEKLAFSRKEILRQTAMLASLRQNASAEDQEAAQVEADFEIYRRRYREELWRRGAGRVLGEFVTTKGERYQGARIKKITSVEMTLMHSGGSANIPVAELPKELREQYHLDVEEAARLEQEAQERAAERRRQALERRRAAMEAEEERLAREQKRAKRYPDARSEPERTPEQSEELLSLMQKLQVRYAALARLRQDIANAQANRNGPDRSPPGSLQTWEERIAELLRKIAAAEGQISVLEDQARQLNPRYRPPRGRFAP